MTNDQKNKEMCKLLGMCWHEPDIARYEAYRLVHWLNPSPPLYCLCGNKECEELNHDFFTDSGKLLLLREMRKREDWPFFLDQELGGNCDLVPIDLLLDQTGKLLELTLEWMRGEKG